MNEAKIVGFKVDTPRLETDEGTIEGPTAYYITVEKTGAPQTNVQVDQDTFITLNRYIGD